MNKYIKMHNSQTQSTNTKESYSAQEAINNQPEKEISAAYFANIDFANIDKEILEYWSKNSIFEKSIENRKNQGAKHFTFYDGPPFANGLPHYGHLLTGYLKDIYCRYQAMKGKVVERRFGWDCHGLPAEMQAEKELGISGKLAIQKYGVEKFNQHCAKSVMKYVNEWEEYVHRQGRWVDFKNSYKTMDIDFMESVLWCFKELYKKGYVYESLKILPYSYACETPLSNFETRLDNSYREVTDKTVTVAFQIKKNDIYSGELFILAWTTTPWTLPSNLALAVNNEIEYCLVEKDSKGYILATSCLAKYKDAIGENIIKTFKGKDLVGLDFEPLMPYFKDKKLDNPKCFTILHGDFVTNDGGTGCVHIAPGFGEEDFNLCSKNNMPIVCPIDNSGKFTKEVNDLEGQNVFSTIDTIIIKLKASKNWIKTESYKHSYPHCWRTDTPLIYRAVSSFYIKVTSFKDRMLELNQNINWIPGSVKDNLFGKWLENAKDWAVSRNRFWGTPIPVWKSTDPSYPRVDVYGSIKELEADFGVKITNLHKEHLDKLTRQNPDDPTGKSMMVRCEDVFDCWFESGSMPFAQKHYPFENKEWFEGNFPADFIVEYAAQTRGWFYTLMVLSTALFDKNPFSNCIAHGVVLDQMGQKLSKRLNNYSDPIEIFNNFSSDAVRLTMVGSGVTKGSELKIDSKGEMIMESIKNIIKPLYNASHFFMLYKKSDKIDAKICFNEKYEYSQTNILDQYILLKLKNFITSVDEALENFDTVSAVENTKRFMDILTNWYIRRSRNRFWKKEKDQDKQDAYDTLYTCIIYICKTCAPLMPFTAEKIYLTLASGNSVHLEDYPIIPKINIDPQKHEELIETMDAAIEICSTSLFLRNKFNIKIRQPLQEMKLAILKDINLDLVIDIIKDEVNIKEISIIQDVSSYAKQDLQLYFPLIGKRIPSSIKNLVSAQKSNAAWHTNSKDGTLTIDGIELLPEEYSIKFKPNSENDAVIATKDFIVILDTKVTPELKEEGLARDIVRAIQSIRKELDLEISSFIEVELIHANGTLQHAWHNHFDYICHQCLIDNKKGSSWQNTKEFEVEIDDANVKLKISY